MMISDNLPRRSGLDEIVGTIVRSEAPLRDVFSSHGDFLLPHLLVFACETRAMSAENFIDQIASGRGKMRSRGIGPDMSFAAEFLREGSDYLAVQDRELREAFWLGDQAYHWVDVQANAYNPCFVVSLFPHETISIRDKAALMQEFSDPRFPRGYEHVKTLLLTGNGRHYLATVPGGKRVDTDAIGRSLGLSSNERRGLRLAGDDPIAVMGREIGSVSPLIRQDKLQNVEAIFVAGDLMKGYSRPHYSFPIDKRSAIAVGDTADLLASLQAVPGYPRIEIYKNS